MDDSFMIWSVPVPGHFLDQVSYLDLETRKVPCSYQFPSGEKLSRRWSAFMAGVANNGHVFLIETIGDEVAFLRAVREAIAQTDTVIYRGTRQFDEMILKGRFTYARRGHAEVPFYPAMPDAEELTWDRHRSLPSDRFRLVRERELDSRYVPEVYARDPLLVLVHNLRDVLEMVGDYGEPDEEATAWIHRVLTDQRYAASLLPEVS